MNSSSSTTLAAPCTFCPHYHAAVTSCPLSLPVTGDRALPSRVIVCRAVVRNSVFTGLVAVFSW